MVAAVFAAVRRTRSSLHVHSERIFLVGSGEGAAVGEEIQIIAPDAAALPEKAADVAEIYQKLERFFTAVVNFEVK